MRQTGERSSWWQVVLGLAEGIAQRLGHWELAAVLASLFLSAAQPARAQETALPPVQLTVALGSGDRACRISWAAVPGQQYQLQRSLDLVLWEEVAVLMAQQDPVIQIETGDRAAGKTFWRVVLLGTSPEPVTVAPIVANYELGNAASAALTRIVTDGNQPVSSVVFYDDGILLGNAVQGLGNDWSFELVWDGASPKVRQLKLTFWR